MIHHVYDICPDCRMLIRPGRLDVHSRCNPAAQAPGPATLDDVIEDEPDELPVYLDMPRPSTRTKDQR